MYVQKGLDPEGLFTKGGTESQRLEPTAQAATWEECEREGGGGVNPPLIQVFVSENAFQAM